MKKKIYMELSRAQSLHQTYLIGLKYAANRDQYERVWANRPRFEQHEIQEKSSAVEFVGREGIEQEGQEIPVGF